MNDIDKNVKMVFFLQENAHFGGPEGPGGGPKTANKKLVGAQSRLPAANKKITEKMAQDELLNKTKMKTRAKQMKK